MFHLAFPILNLEETIAFYTTILNAKIGRSASNWVDFNFHWNQITVQVDPNFKKLVPIVGKEGIPINHFGVVLILSDWLKLKEELIKKEVSFLIQPKIVFEGEAGEQHSFFVEDPNGYAIEFKGFEEFGQVFQATR